MQTLCFINPGEIDIDAAMTMGVNAKIESSAIGYFGTGLKYAIAVLLRSGAPVTIYAGTKSYRFGCEVKVTRGTEYTVVTMNGQPLGFTTDLGKNWELWQAYRELRCNCTDEGGFMQTLNVPVKAGQTVVVVESDALVTIHCEAHKWFLATKPIEVVADKFAGGFPTGMVEIHNRDPDGGSIFYKGVRVAAPDAGQIFTYNFLGHVKLTEDRSVADSWNIRYRVSQALAITSTPSVMTKVLSNPDSIEHKRTYWSAGMAMSPEVKTILANYRGEIKGDLKDLQKAAQGPKEKKVRKTSNEEASLLIEARAILSDIGIEVKASIYVSNDLGEGVMGMVHEAIRPPVPTIQFDAIPTETGETFVKEIWLAESVMVQGAVRIASTILEEHLHIEHGFADCTREFQNYLMDLVVQNGLNCLGKAQRKAA